MSNNNSSSKKEYKKMSFRDLVVWQQAYDFAKGVHALSRQLPQEERYALTSQLTRMAFSMPVQIAQGQRKWAKAEFVKHLNYARNNSYECETYLLLIGDLFSEFKEDADKLVEANTIIQKMLSALIYTIENPKNKKNESDKATVEEPKVVAVAA
ncbi:four helix bundle protein [Candidatus Uhrbacteria bacterium]|nr:four helix bundle protein [Candidatus Uhrbacteria bacterium]